MSGWKKQLVVRFMVGAWICVFCLVTPALAQSSSSNSYTFEEATLGSGGLVQSTSSNFQTNSVLGDLAIGESASGNYQVSSGNVTPRDPTLAVAVNATNINFGQLTSNAAMTATATFSVLNYTTFGYVVQLTGTPLKNGNHSIDPMTTTNTSQPGTEQFGINLVANTTPTSFGTNPSNGQFGFGRAAVGYDTSNKFRFVDGEIVAEAPKQSGITDYTISYLVNVADLTPGGVYTTNQTLIITGMY